MKNASRWTMAATLLIGLAVGVEVTRTQNPAHAAEAPDAANPLAAFQADVARLKTIVPDQSHTMSDVAYHFSNLYFAGQNENWPLAQFYSDELRSSPNPAIDPAGA